MNDLTSMLSTTGLIATLISVLFAIAALVIANRRKKHHLAMQRAGVVPANHAAPVMRPEAAPMVYTTVPAPASTATMAENMVYDSTRATSSPLFKRLGRVGGVEQVAPAASYSEAPTQEEQKSAWE